MTVARVTEIIASSDKSFDDAVRKGIERARKTLTRVQGAWVKDLKLDLDDGEIIAWRVTLKITFVLEE